MTNGRVPPQATDIEQVVLGSMLTDASARSVVLNVLTDAGVFYVFKHQQIFEAIVRLDEAGEPTDLVTVTDALKRTKQLDDIGGGFYLSELSTQALGLSSVERYCRILQEKALLRSMISAHAEGMDQCYDTQVDAFEALDVSQQALYDLSRGLSQHRATGMVDIIPDALLAVEAATRAPGGVSGLSTGYVDLDKLTAGLQNGDQTVIAARTSMGKTALALCVALNVAGAGTNVYFISLEMSKQQLGKRLLSIQSKRQTHRPKGDDLPDIQEAAGKLVGLPIWVIDTPALTSQQIRNQVRILISEHGPGLVIVDYLQLISMIGGYGNHVVDVGITTRSNREMLKEFDVPGLLLCQLSRAVEGRQGKKPTLPDLRDSGNIEEHADNVWLLHRPSRYGIERYIPPGADPGIDHIDTKGLGVVEVVKQRMGPCGEVYLHFDESSARFDSRASTPTPAEGGRVEDWHEVSEQRRQAAAQEAPF